MRSSLTLPIAIVVGGCIIALAVYTTVKSRHPTGPTGVGNPAAVRPVDSADHILGNPTAQVQIVEYSDFDCSFCKDFHTTLHEIIADEGAQGKVSWIIRNFPLTELHPNAKKHAEAAECVAEVAGNDAYWRFADALFDQQPVDPTTYGTLAAKAGAPGDAFATCYTNAATTVDPRIMEDRQNALDTGAVGTPYALILAPGKSPVVMSGAYSYDAAKQLVDDALAGN